MVITLQKICANPKAHERLLLSYKMMLNFYGMKLKDDKTGNDCSSCRLIADDSERSHRMGWPIDSHARYDLFTKLSVLHVQYVELSS